MATDMAKELELPATMVPKLLQCLSRYDPDDFAVFRNIRAARNRYVLFEQHSSADVTEDSQSDVTEDSQSVST